MDTFDNIVDRTGWPAGDWDSEPDRATWVHEETGARCTVRRGPLGSWCGYVGLRPNHPAAGKDYNDLDIDVHGDLTYGAYCRPLAEDEWIRYRIMREKMVTESLVYPDGDAARRLREDRKADTSTLTGWLELMRMHGMCHDDCPHGLWWVGFDCSHAWDVVPGMQAHYARRGIKDPFSFFGRPVTYRTFEWVAKETNRLATQLFDEKFIASMEGKHG